MDTALNTGFRQESNSARCTQELGVALGALLRTGDIVCLSGDMGAGKTVFSRGIGIGFGAQPPLTSPTYNLVHVHSRARDATRLYHIDLYRIERPTEADSLGLDDIFDSASAVVIEWPERLGHTLPRGRLWIDFELIDDCRRELSFAAPGGRYAALVEAVLARSDEAR